MKAILLFSILLSASLVLDRTSYNLTQREEEVKEIGVVALEDGMVKKNGKYGFPATMTYSSDGDALFSSASGEVYIYSEKEDVRAGDSLSCRGAFSSPAFFIADEVIPSSSSPFREMRKKAEAFIRSRLSPLQSSDAENLSLMLLLALSDDGASIISSLSREKGVSHVFALSGMHLSVISSFFLPFISLVLGDGSARKVVLIPLFIFTFLSGFRASLLRALIFRILFTFFPDSDKESIFSLTFIIHAAISPESLLRAGAVFSYLSISGLFLLSPPLEAFSYRIIRLRLSFIFNSISCLVFTIPYSFMLFGTYSLSGIIYSPLVNFLVTIYMGMLFIFLFFPFFPSVLSMLYATIMRILSLDFISSSFDTLDVYFLLLAFSLSLPAISFLKRNVLAYILKPCGTLITRKQKR